MKGTGDIEETTVIENTYGIDTLSSEVVGIVGVPVDISTSTGLTLVGVTVDKVKGTTMLEVASWGKKYIVSFDEYYEESGLLDGVNWID